MIPNFEYQSLTYSNLNPKATFISHPLNHYIFLVVYFVSKLNFILFFHKFLENILKVQKAFSVRYRSYF
jgi:hypothetical protein